MTHVVTMTGGQPDPIGATFDGDGVNFAVFSQHARAVTLCLFDDEGNETRMPLPECIGGIWFGYATGIKPGQRYGYRAHGPYRPEEGHRFNANKLLLDPYARQIVGSPQWGDSLRGYRSGSKQKDLSFSSIDSAPHMPRCVVVDPSIFESPSIDRPNVPMAGTIIYEAHTKGLTQQLEVPGRGKFTGLASDRICEYLVDLGVTTIELLPVHAFVDDEFLVRRGLTNYWGYQTLGFFAPDPRYLSAGDVFEFRHTVDKLHEAGIEVVLDVVYNHTCEGNELGPTLSFRGLDNLSYYRLANNPRYYINDTGTGNTLNVEHPMVMRMILDSLRYWVDVMRVDGFRFDLCSTLGRRADGFDRDAPLFQAILQDPTLCRVKLIAEPWDIGPGGYQLGAFHAPFSEWNDRFRDGVRRFWRGDPGLASDLADRITGSAHQFDHSLRPATSSVNMITAHDGFTLEDLVSYEEKHNEPNGEDNRDGHSDNHSDNFGVEGPSDDPRILAERRRRKRNLLATLLLSQGTPMIVAGDELGRTQLGNNNAYCQDNESTWIDWAGADYELQAFTKRLIKFRRTHSIFRQKLFLHSKERALDGKEDLFWRRPDGSSMSSVDWENPELDIVCAELRTASGSPIFAALDYAIFVVFNRGSPTEVDLPTCPPGQQWSRSIDTDNPTGAPEVVTQPRVLIARDSVCAFVLEESA